MSARFELDGAVTVDQAPDVRRFVERLHERTVDNRERMARIAMVSHELFENAVKFSVDGVASLRVDVTHDPTSHVVRITTRNRAHRADVECLRRLARELDECGDVMTLYIAMMRRSPGSRGGLGLCRVAAEGEMRLELELEDDVVTIHAELTETP